MTDHTTGRSSSIVDVLSCGVFVNIIANDPISWRSQLDWARRLDGRSHIEVWLEHIPNSGTARAELSALLADECVIVRKHSRLS